jgi:hypothetical protein
MTIQSAGCISAFLVKLFEFCIDGEMLNRKKATPKYVE